MKARAVEEEPKSKETNPPSEVSEDEELVDAAVKVYPILLEVERQFTKDGKLVDPEAPDQETILVQDFHVSPAAVEVSRGLTLNLGQYETARLGVTIRIPCYREEVEAAYRFGRRFVEDRIQKEAAEIRKRRSANEVAKRKVRDEIPF